MRCSDCKKLNDDTRWEKIGKWMMKQIFPTIYDDMKADFFTQGISQGYKLGWDQRAERAKIENEGRIDPLFKLRQGESLNQDETNFLLKNYLGATIQSDIFTIGQEGKEEVFYLNGRKVDDGELARLREEAKILKGFHIYTIFQDTLTETARVKMFEKSKTYEDMFWGKTMLYNLDIIKKITDKLSS